MASESECANPLLLEWVGEWLETARARNTKGVTVYRKAYDSLKACPLPFNHPSEAKQLHGFGDKLCERLTEKMRAYCKDNGLPMPEMAPKTKKTKADDGEGPAKKPRKAKPYVPTIRSGPYALIRALSTLSENSPMGITKQELIELAQPHCDASFTAPPDPTKFYTAWNSMKTLVGKDLVEEKGRPLRKYCLTEEGWEVAKRINKTLDPKQTTLDLSKNKGGADAEVLSDVPSSQESVTPQRFDTPEPARPEVADLVPQGNPVSDESGLPSFRPIILQPLDFEIRLVLDIREIRAKKDRDYMADELAKKGVVPIVRSLEVGDAMWVAKCRSPLFLGRNGAEGDEVVLDWIVERKRLDDLVHSIKDGRFHEQKFRLRKSGAKNVIYIIEEISMSTEHFQKYEESVESAITSTQVVNNYFVKKTLKMDDTITYLAKMTEMLKERYEPNPLRVIPTKVLTAQNYLPLLKHLREREPHTGHYITYPAFASLASKSDNLTIRDMFLKMLMVARGVTGEKAMEIQKRWKTPQAFIKAYEACGDGPQGLKRKRELVSDQMGNLVGRKKIAKGMSAKIAEIWSDV